MNKLLDPQYLDNNFERYYLITWPECQFFDQFDADDAVYPTVLPGTTTPASFVSMDFIAELAEQENE